jgi:DNA ligase (NAD+)
MNMKIEIPTHCPCCNYKLELVNDQLFCRNQACDAQLSKRVEHFCKTMGIKGMGAKTIEKLGLADITEIYYLDQAEVASQLSSIKTAEKLLSEIEKSRNAPLNQVLASFSIPLVGNTASTKISSVVNHIDEINLETCKQAGLGDKATENLLSWLELDFQEMREFLPFSFRSEMPVVNTSGKTVCITGKLSSYKTKAEAYKQLTDHGFRISESVTKTTDYLVDEEDKSSTKRKKAEQLGIQIITNLNTFLREHIND